MWGYQGNNYDLVCSAITVSTTSLLSPLLAAVQQEQQMGMSHVLGALLHHVPKATDKYSPLIVQICPFISAEFGLSIF